MLARSLRSALAIAALAVVARAAVACSSPADSAKKSLPTDPVQAPDMATDDPASTSPSKPAASPEAGIDAAPAVGQLCEQLAQCCKDLGSAGYDTTMCKSVLSTNNEDACYAKHDSYKQSGDCI
jgi:hypothetical protein